MNLCDASAGCFRPPSSWIKERGWSNKHVFAQGISANGIAAYFEEADPTLLGTLLAQFVVVATAEVHRSVFQGGGKAAAFRAQGGGEGRRRGGGDKRKEVMKGEIKSKVTEVKTLCPQHSNSHALT